MLAENVSKGKIKIGPFQNYGVIQSVWTSLTARSHIHQRFPNAAPMGAAGMGSCERRREQVIRPTTAMLALHKHSRKSKHQAKSEPR